MNSTVKAKKDRRAQVKSRSRFFFSCWDGAKGTVFCAPSFLFATARRRRFFLGAGKSKSGKLSRRDIFLQTKEFL